MFQKTENSSRKESPTLWDTTTAAGKKDAASGLDKAFRYFLDTSVLVFVLYYLHRIWSFLGNTHFWSDENFHAYVRSVILKTHRIPFILPDEVYGMREFSYPPLFHIIGALAMSIGGFPVLKYINLTLLALFLFGSYALIRKYYSSYEASIACLLLSLSSVIAVNTVRFMTEMLSMVLIFLSFFFVLLALKKLKKSFAIIAGISTGLLLLSKQTGFVVLGFYVVLFLWFFFRKAKEARTMSIVVGVSVGIYVPYLILAICNNVDVLGFLSQWLGDAKETAPWLGKALRESHEKYDSPLREFVYRFYEGYDTGGGNGAIISFSPLLPLFYFLTVRAKDPPHHYIFVMLIYLAAVMVIWHITNPRHTITLLPLLAFLVGCSFTRMTVKPIARVAVLLLLVFAVHSTYHMPDYRQRRNAPNNFRALFETIKGDDSIEGRIFCINAFDVLMYTGKPVIWPQWKLRNVPFDLVETRNAAKLYSLLRQYEIDTILIRDALVKGNTFYGRNYPIHFRSNCNALIQQKKMSTVSHTGSLWLLRVL